MKRLYGFILILALASAVPAFSQQRWERNYGGTGDDAAASVQQTSDGGYIVAGTTSSFGAGGYDVWLIKTNALGDTLWTRTYGGRNNDAGFSVQQTSDGGYIVAGWTQSFGAGGYDVYLIKTNATGDTLWTRTYPDSGPDYYDGYFVQQTSDGGYVIAGSIYYGRVGTSDICLIKTNASGDTLWTRTYGGAGNEEGWSVQQTSDTGYIVAGWTQSFGAGGYDVYLIKTNASGDTLWTKTYGGTNDDVGWSVQQTSDTGYIIAGYTGSFGAGYLDVYVIKTNASGYTLWTRTYGGTNADWGHSVRQTLDGGYIVAGVTLSYGAGNGDVYLIKTNASGDTLWTRTYGGASSEVGNSIQQTQDGGYIVAGYTNSFGNGDQVYLVKTDSLGRSTGVEETAGVRDQGLGIRVTAKPNPFTTFATLPGHEGERFSLYDVSGRKVGTYKGDRIGMGLGPGVYFLRSSDKKDKPLRIVKVR
jgi:hypothetical protein